MGALLKLTTLDHASATLLILKGRFDAHTSPILVHALMRGGPIGDQQPGFLISWLPTGPDPPSKLMLFPTQDLSIPLLPHLGFNLLSSLPPPLTLPPTPPPP